ncbi:MAG: hypothetical protein ABFD57_04390 [Smithella sp.]|nr:hypothetical protein [Syntrophaceae bacterium]NTW76652.1 hypothetical protein [Syntrophaceae bacterium]
MKIVSYALKNMNILNLLLLAASTGLFFTLVYPLLDADVKVNIPRAKAESVKQEAKILPAENPPTTLDYIVVTEKNLFHPQRRMPLSKAEEEMVARPEIIFYGAIISGEKKIAYIEDKKNPYSTPGRGKRQRTVAQGTVIGGYTLKEVNPETIVLVRGNDRMVVNLRDQKDRQAAEPPASQHPPQPVNTPRVRVPKIPGLP